MEKVVINKRPRPNEEEEGEQQQQQQQQQQQLVESTAPTSITTDTNNNNNNNANGTTTPTTLNSDVDSQRGNSLLHSLRGMQRNGYLCDLNLLAKEDMRAVRVHAVVIAASSNVLAGMLSTNRDTIELPCEEDALVSLVSYIYSGKLELDGFGASPTLVNRVRKLADDLNIQGAVDSCDVYMNLSPTSSFELRRTLKGHSAYVYDICRCGLGGRYLASASRDCSILIWDPATGIRVREITGHRDRVFTLLPMSNYSKLISGSWDFTIKIWDTETWALEQTLEGHTGWVTALTLVENNYLLSGSADNTIRVYDMKASFDCERVLRGHEKAIYSLVYIAEQRLVASGSEDCTIRIWNVQENWHCVRILAEHLGTVRCMCVYGSRLISGSADKTIKLWRLDTGVCEFTLDKHQDWVESLCLIDSRRMVSASRDGTIRIWRLGSWMCLQTLTGHSHWVYAVVLLNNGDLASASADFTVRIWSHDSSSNSSIGYESSNSS